MVDRTKSLNVRVKVEELRMLAAVADREGMTASAWIRKKIRESYRRSFGDKAPK